MKLFTRLFLAAASLFLPQASAWAANFTVLIGQNGDLSYSPSTLSIRPGDQVTFQWVSGTHPTQLTSSPGATSPAWTSFSLGSGNTTQTFTFTTPGRYDYVCIPHASLGMVGSITVSAATPTQEAKAAAAGLSVYPNPVRGGQAVLKLAELKPGQAYRLRVTNIIGREVQSVALRPEQLSTGQPIDFSSLPAGLYICTVFGNDKALMSKRVTVQN